MAAILETDRLMLRNIEPDDAAFMLDLVNQPTYHKYIGDKGVRTITDAKNFINNVVSKSYVENGFGHYVIELKGEAKIPIGTCGFVNRASLDDPDVGFALLPQYEKKGYAFEAADAVMKYGREQLGMKRIAAITTQDNEASIKLLGRLGLKFERLIEMPTGEVLNLFIADA